MNKNTWLRSFFVLGKLFGSTEKDSCFTLVKKLFSLTSLAVITSYNAITTFQSSENGRFEQNHRRFEDGGLNEPPIVLQSTGKLAGVECKKATIISFYVMVWQYFTNVSMREMIKFANITKYNAVVAFLIYY